MWLVRVCRNSMMALTFMATAAQAVAATTRGVVGARPPVIYSAFIDLDANEVSVVGERFISVASPVRVQLGTQDIDVLAVTDNVVTARLPQPVADGIYRLDISTSQGTASLSVTLSHTVDVEPAAALPTTSGIPGPAGPRGEKGDKGEPGTNGVAGPTGPQGAAGSQGPAGAAGSTGATGPQGVAGPAGTAGPPGATGPQGIQGVAGPAGPAGPTGPAGATGSQGAPGILNVQYIASDVFQGDPTKEESTRGVSLCPDKTVVIGGGAMPESADGAWALLESFPVEKPHSWQVHYKAIDSSAKEIFFRVYAVCVTVP